MIVQCGAIRNNKFSQKQKAGKRKSLGKSFGEISELNSKSKLGMQGDFWYYMRFDINIDYYYNEDCGALDVRGTSF